MLVADKIEESGNTDKKEDVRSKYRVVVNVAARDIQTLLNQLYHDYGYELYSLNHNPTVDRYVVVGVRK